MMRFDLVATREMQFARAPHYGVSRLRAAWLFYRLLREVKPGVAVRMQANRAQGS